MMKKLILVLGVSVSLAGCSSGRFDAGPGVPVAAARPTGPAGPSGASGPSVEINAPANVVRQVIAQRARQRGALIAGNDSRGVVLERDLPQTSPVLEASCGPQQAGRRIRIELLTAEQPGGTVVSERRTVVDPGGLCPVRLNETDIAEANTSLNELKQQVEGRFARR